MYQYASKDKLQSEKSKANAPITNGSLHIDKKIPMQTKSLFSYSSSLENSGEQKGKWRQFEPTPIKPNNTGIPTQMKERFENLSGFSFDDVKVHYNSSKPTQLQALAYTQGNQVYVAPSQEKHLRHELGHVVQQKSGAVRATGSMNGLPVNTDEALERQAELTRFTPASIGINGRNDVIQGVLAGSAAAGGVAAPILTLANLQTYIDANSSKTVKDIIKHQRTAVNIFWDGAIAGAAATTEMTFVGGGLNVDLFNAMPPQIALIGALPAATPYQIQIDIHLETALPMAPPPATTWEGNLLHELEAHTKLAGKIIDNFSSTNKAKNIEASINGRTESAEHYSYATGGGTDIVMSRAIDAAPAARKYAVFFDMLQDRLHQLRISTNVLTPHRVVPVGMNHNGYIESIIKWSKGVIDTILKPAGIVLTRPQTAAINQIYTDLRAAKL